MKLKPLPPYLDRLVYATEVDFQLRQQKEVREYLPIGDLEFLLWEWKYHVRLISNPVIGATDCFLLRKSDGKTPPKHEVVKKVRHKIALYIGIVPAAFCEFLPDHFVEGYYEEYKDSLTAKCRYNHDYCVRPLHLIPCTYLGHPLRPGK